MIPFFTKDWTWRQKLVIALWLTVTICLALLLFSPVGPFFSFGVLLATGIAAAVLSVITIPLLLRSLHVHIVPERIITTEKSYEDGNQPQVFVFEVPQFLQENTAHLASLQTNILHPDQNFTYPSNSLRYAEVGFDNIITNEALQILLNTYKTSHDTARVNQSALNIFIIGLGPTGLITALRAYANGASITGFDSRTQYTRKNILRISQDFLIGGSAGKIIPHNIYETLFFYDQIFGRDPEAASNIQSTLTKKFILNLKTINLDPVFANESDACFHAISTYQFEALLYDLLSKLQGQDPDNIKLHKGGSIKHIAASEGRVIIQDENNKETLITANWIVNASGANGRINKKSSILEALFPFYPDEPHYVERSSQAPYLAATLLLDGSPGSRRRITRDSSNTIPHSFRVGSEHLMVLHPELEQQINLCLEDYQIPQGFYRKHDTLHEQRVFYGYDTKKSYLENKNTALVNRTRDNHTAEINLACSYYAVLDGLNKISGFGWKRIRLPLIRLLTTSDTTYLGMELCPDLLNQLNSDSISSEEKKMLFTQWIKIALEQFYDKKLIDKISVEQGTAFSFQLRTCNKIMHRYPSGVQVFTLGDALAPPHFLTGSGVESAAISVELWIQYLQKKINQEQYIEQIKSDIQEAAIDKVYSANSGLQKLNMFVEYKNQYSPVTTALQRVSPGQESRILNSP